MQYHDLPNEIIVTIFLNCDYMSVVNLSRIYKLGYVIYRSEEFWKARILLDFGEEGWSYPFYVPELSNHGRYVQFSSLDSVTLLPGSENFESIDSIYRGIKYYGRHNKYLTRTYINNSYLDPIYPNKSRIVSHNYNFLIDILTRKNIPDDVFGIIWDDIYGTGRIFKELRRQILVDFYIVAHQNNKNNTLECLRSYFYKFPQTYEDYYLATLFRDIDLLNVLLDKMPHTHPSNISEQYTIACIYGWEEGKERIEKYCMEQFNYSVVEQYNPPNYNLQLGSLRRIDVGDKHYNHLEDWRIAFKIAFKLRDIYVPYLGKDDYVEIYKFLCSNSNKEGYNLIHTNYFREALIIGHRGYMRYFLSKLQPEDVYYVVKLTFGAADATSLTYLLYLNLATFTRKEFVSKDFILPEREEWKNIFIDDEQNIIPPLDRCCIATFRHTSIYVKPNWF